MAESSVLPTFEPSFKATTVDEEFQTRPKKLFRPDHFRQHLKHSHAGTSGKWSSMLENACMKDEPPLPTPSAMEGSQPSSSVSSLSTTVSYFPSDRLQPVHDTIPRDHETKQRLKMVE